MENEQAKVEAAQDGSVTRADNPNRRTAFRAALLSVPVVLTLSSSASANNGGSCYVSGP